MAYRKRATRTGRKRKGAPRRRVGVKSGGGRRRIAKKRSAAPQYAVVTETVNLGDFQANTVYSDHFSLWNFPRAKTCAESFMFYRCKSVTFEYLPSFNTFQETSGGPTKPYFQYVMNRNGASTLLTETQMLEMGANPIAFSSKKSITYKPNLVQSLSVLSTATGSSGLPQSINVGSTPVYDRWLATARTLKNQSSNSVLDLNPPATSTPLGQIVNQAEYYGHQWNVHTDVSSLDYQLLGTWMVHAVWEFKGPQTPDIEVTPITGAQAV